jgi:hypothetical protein
MNIAVLHLYNDKDNSRYLFWANHEHYIDFKEMKAIWWIRDFSAFSPNIQILEYKEGNWLHSGSKWVETGTGISETKIDEAYRKYLECLNQKLKNY